MDAAVRKQPEVVLHLYTQNTQQHCVARFMSLLEFWPITQL
jgi:hypothetical protein